MSAHPEPVAAFDRGGAGPHGGGDPARPRLQRRDLGTSVEPLRGRVAELTDWRRQVREHRSQLIVGAAVAGFALGGLMMLRRRR